MAAPAVTETPGGDVLNRAKAAVSTVAMAVPLLRTPYGRRRVARGLRELARPALMRLAARHRSGPVARVRVVAVVGSFGKTTTTAVLIAALGARQHQRLGANAGAHLAAAILRIRPWDRHAVIEVGISAPGQMAPLARVVRPNVAVVTSIGSEHNRSLGTLDVTRHEKAEMVRVLSPDGLAVLNGDDPNVLWMRTQTPAQVRTFGFGEANDVRATDVMLDWPRGTRFTLRADGQERRVQVRLLGRHLVYPILAAVTVALAEGFSLDHVLPRVAAVEPVSGRMAVVALENGAFLIRDAYKSSLETLDAALDVLAEIPAGRRVVVLGEVSEPPGSQGPIYRRLGGRVAGMAARAIFVSGNYQRYAAGARRARMPTEALVDAGRSLRRAVEALRRDLGPGDVALIKGRDTQRLDRVALALMGREVRCERSFCELKGACETCPLLARGAGPPL